MHTPSLRDGDLRCSETRPWSLRDAATTARPVGAPLPSASVCAQRDRRDPAWMSAASRPHAAPPRSSAPLPQPGQRGATAALKGSSLQNLIRSGSGPSGPGDCAGCYCRNPCICGHQGMRAAQRQAGNLCSTQGEYGSIQGDLGSTQRR